MSTSNTKNSVLPEISSADFIQGVLASKKPVVVEFWTAWSRPCQILDSVLQKLAADHAGKIKVVGVNAAECLDLSLVYYVQSVPTLLCFVEGSPRWQVAGTATLEAIQRKLKPLFEKPYASSCAYLPPIYYPGVWPRLA